MGREIVTKCGMRCDLCVAYIHHPDQKDPEERKRASDTWEKYFGFRLEPDEIVCGGCLEDEKGLLDKNCPVRPCVIRRGYDTCAQCGEFDGCDSLKERLIGETGCGDRHWGELPAEDRKYLVAFINHKRLSEMRKG